MVTKSFICWGPNCECTLDMCTLVISFLYLRPKDIWASSWVELPAETTSWPFNRGLDLADIRVTFYVTCQVSFCPHEATFCHADTLRRRPLSFTLLQLLLVAPASVITFFGQHVKKMSGRWSNHHWSQKDNLGRLPRCPNWNNFLYNHVDSVDNQCNIGTLLQKGPINDNNCNAKKGHIKWANYMDSSQIWHVVTGKIPKKDESNGQQASHMCSLHEYSHAHKPPICSPS